MTVAMRPPTGTQRRGSAGRPIRHDRDHQAPPARRPRATPAARAPARRPRRGDPPPADDVVAGAGFGKSTLLSAWAAGRELRLVHGFARGRVARHLRARDRRRAPAARARAPRRTRRTRSRPPPAPAPERGRARPGPGVRGGLVCEALRTELRATSCSCVDDVHEVERVARRDPGDRIALPAGSGAPALVLVASRAELPFPIERLRGQGQVLELTELQTSHSTSTRRRRSSLIARRRDTAAAAELHRRTGGWPRGRALAVETLRGVPPPTARRARRASGGRRARPRVSRSRGVRRGASRGRGARARVAPLERFTAGFCERSGSRTPTRPCASLARRGLVRRAPGASARVVRARVAACASSRSRG